MIVKPEIVGSVTRPGCRVNDTGLPKKRYADSHEAKQVVLQMRAHGTTAALDAYRCSACGFWHVGRDIRRWIR